jgi:Zn-dependent peptidase ImmA (M78 family)
MNAGNVFHALATSRESQRLVTDAYSWDQKASRAFAAEFLAPQQALISRLAKSTADRLTVRKLSMEFLASTYVIERQLENAGVPLSFD